MTVPCVTDSCLSRFGSFHGQDEQSLSKRFYTCHRTLEYTKQLPKHDYEIDMPETSVPEEEKRKYRQSITSKSVSRDFKISIM